MRPGQALGYAQVGEQRQQGLGGHRPTAIRVDVQLAWRYVLARAAFGNELFGEAGALPFSDQPADHEAAEEVLANSWPV